MKEHVVLLLAVSAFSFLSALPAAGNSAGVVAAISFFETMLFGFQRRNIG